jgi:predicted nucleotidyltransferase
LLKGENQMESSFTCLPDGFLDALVNELDHPDVIGITLGGSYVRGEATAYSDVDLACFFQEQTSLPPSAFSLAVAICSVLPLSPWQASARD